MRAYIAGTLAAVALYLGVASTASADWRFRERVRFEQGRRIVFTERYWYTPVVVTTPVAVPVVAAPPLAVDVVPVEAANIVVGPSFYFGYNRGLPYRSFNNHRRR